MGTLSRKLPAPFHLHVFSSMAIHLFPLWRWSFNIKLVNQIVYGKAPVRLSDRNIKVNRLRVQWTIDRKEKERYRSDKRINTDPCVVIYLCYIAETTLENNQFRGITTQDRVIFSIRYWGLWKITSSFSREKKRMQSRWSVGMTFPISNLVVEYVVYRSTAEEPLMTIKVRTY